MTSVAEPQPHSPTVGSQDASAPPSATPQDKSKPFELYVCATIAYSLSIWWTRSETLYVCSFGRATYASHADACIVRDTLAVDPEVRAAAQEH